MKIDEIKLLYEYNDWANNLILSTAEHVSPEQLTQSNSSSFGSLHRTLFHTFDSEYSWRILCQHRRLEFNTLKLDNFPDLASLRTRWDAEMAEMRGYLNSLSDDDLPEVIVYEVEEGTRRRVLWHCLFHVVNHGMQHRSECAAMLTEFDQSPGNLDFTRFLNER